MKKFHREAGLKTNNNKKKKKKKKKSLMELDRPHYRTINSSTNSTNSELFICFASRLSSSSSMKISKSILSPGRARDPPVSLSTSLSRRLRSNGSMKGGQASPMFPAGGGGGGGKKRGCAFENPEPSSPKVTCIGQVRVKTKKKKNKAKQTRSLSRRRSGGGGGEVSFRKVEQQGHDLLGNSEENVQVMRGQRYPPSNSSTHFQQPGGGDCIPPHRNQRWVHLPVTICEALRTFGAEFSCLFPCRSSSCFSTNEREEEKLKNAAAEDERRRRRRRREEGAAGNDGGESSCGAVFARWFVALQDCEGRQQGREIELVVGGEEEEEEDDDDEEEEKNERPSMRRSSRRHVFENIEFKENDDFEEVKGGENDEEEKEARLSICIPPKNALLLMRCRSDPMKMATLTNRFWESPAATQHRDDDDDGEDEDEEEEEERGEDLDDNHIQYTEVTNVSTEEVEADDLASERRVSTGYDAEIDANLGTGMQENKEEDQKLCDILHNGVEVDDESVYKFCSVEVPADLEMAEKPILEMEKEEEGEESSRTSHSSSSSGNSEKLNLESDATGKETPESFASSGATEIEWEKAEESIITEENKASEENINLEKEKTTHQNFELQENHQEEKEEAAAAIVTDAEHGDHEIWNSQILPENQDKTTKINREENSNSKVLPDCLLLMMCEPKLSMEVSKETWVCSTDFIRWLPERHAKKVVNATEEQQPKKKVVVTTDCNNLGNHQATTENKTQKPKSRQQQHLLQPPRSSCSLPAAAAAASMATMIEQKLVNAVGYEPFVLTRCKSEPMRTAAAKLAPDSCFWNNRKLEPHRPATFGVGAAGVGC